MWNIILLFLFLWAVHCMSFRMIKCPAFSRSPSNTLTQSPCNDVTLCSDTLAMTSSSCVPGSVEPCGSKKGSRASADHTSVPTQGSEVREAVQRGQPLARWVSALTCDADKSCCHSHFQPSVTLSRLSYLEVMCYMINWGVRRLKVVCPPALSSHWLILLWCSFNWMSVCLCSRGLFRWARQSSRLGVIFIRGEVVFFPPRPPLSITVAEWW